MRSRFSLWICLAVSCGGRTDLTLSKVTLEPTRGGQSQSETAGTGGMMGAVGGAAQGGSRLENSGFGGSMAVAGATGSAAIAGESGTGVCDSGTVSCGSGRAAFCAHLERDPANCGQCGTACSNNQYCSNGVCHPVPVCKGVIDLGGWPEVPTATTWSSSDMVLGDWNGDGAPDLAVADGRGAVNVWRGKGNGTFASRVAYATGDAPFSVGSADLNHDGHADLVFSGSGTVGVLYGKADGTFTVGPHYDSGKSTTQWDTAQAIEDLNGDGTADVAMADGANPYSISKDIQATVSVLYGKADGTLSPRTVIFTAVMGKPMIAIGDINGDTALDLAVAGNGPRTLDQGRLTVLYGRGDGTFVSPLDTLDLPPIGAVAVRDLNRDGMADVILAGTNPWDGSEIATPQVSVLLGRGDNSLAPRLDYGRAKHWGPALIVAELSGDDFPDVAVNGQTGMLDLLLGKGDGNFGPAIGYGVGFHPTSGAVGDVNADSATDLLVADGTAMTVSVLLGRGQGAFVNPGWAMSLRSVALSPATLCPSGCVPQLIADLNRDGWADLVASQCGSDRQNPTPLCVLHGQGDGTFVLHGSYQFPIQLQSLIQAELNGDAWPDLLATSYDRVNDLAIVSTLFGQASGDFKRGNDYPIGSMYPTFGENHAALADLNGDGLTDLVTLSDATPVDNGKVTLWLGVGDGTFRVWRDIVAVDGIGSVAIGDLNGDGWADLALVTAQSGEAGRATVLFGLGQGELTTPIELPVDESPGFLNIADLNGDGWVDLVMTHSSSSAVGVLYGHGNGLFGNEVEYYTNSFAERTDSIMTSGPGPVAIADLDSDGHLDLAVANISLGTVTVLLGNSDGTFSNNASYGTTNDPNEVMMVGFTLGDLNGDGRRDLVVGGDRSAVLINSCR